MNEERIKESLDLIADLIDRKESHENYVVLKAQADLLLETLIKSHFDYLSNLKGGVGDAKKMVMREVSDYYRDDTNKAVLRAVRGGKPLGG